MGVGQKSSVVAQDCILLYRGFPIRRPSAKPGVVENPLPSRLKIGDTAGLEICATKNLVLHPQFLMMADSLASFFQSRFERATHDVKKVRPSYHVSGWGW